MNPVRNPAAANFISVLAEGFKEAVIYKINDGSCHFLSKKEMRKNNGRSKVKTFKVVMGVVLGSFLLSTSVHAAKGGEMKIAYVDLGKVFDEYKKTKEYDVVLEKESQSFQDERQKMIDSVRDNQNKLALLKEEEKKKLEGDLDKQKQQLLEFDRQKRTDLTKKRDEKVREILKEIEKVVADYAKKEDLTLVLNDHSLIYSDPELNITDVILKTLNDNYSKAKK